MITSLTTQTFVEFTKHKGTHLVDFYAPWCGPCKAIAPILESLAQEVTQVPFGKVNVDEEGSLAEEYNISSIPAVLIFKDGEVAQQLVGAQSKEAYKQAIQG